MRYGEANRIQVELVFCALGVGFLLGLVYAALMILRRFLRHSVVAVAAEDVLFCLVSSILTFIFLLDYNSGTVRLYLLLSQFVGFLSVRAAAAEFIAKSRKKACKNTDG